MSDRLLLAVQLNVLAVLIGHAKTSIENLLRFHWLLGSIQQIYAVLYDVTCNVQSTMHVY